MKTTPIFLFSILLLGACGGPAARAKRPGAKAQAAAAVQCGNILQDGFIQYF